MSPRNIPIEMVVKKMKATGNQPGVVHHWKAIVQQWANREHTPDAASVRAMLPLWQERPFYTAAELAPILPALIMALGVPTFSGRIPSAMSPARLATALKVARLPHHQVEGTTYFMVEYTHRIDDMIPMIEEFHYAQR